LSAGENVSATEVVPNGVAFVELKFLIAHWLLCRQGMDWVTCTCCPSRSPAVVTFDQHGNETIYLVGLVSIALSGFNARATAGQGPMMPRGREAAVSGLIITFHLFEEQDVRGHYQ
jgi:hypothetical protein